MGRHSAPADDEDDGADDSAAGLYVADDDTAVTGRHLRIKDLPSASTQSIPIVDAEIAADADAHIAPVLDTPAAEFEPILPGEAVVPPDTIPGPDGLDALDALLGAGEPRRPAPVPQPGPQQGGDAGATDAGEPAAAVDAGPAAAVEQTPSVTAAGPPAADTAAEDEGNAPDGPSAPAPRPSPRPTKAEKDAARDEAREVKLAAREARAEAKQAARAAKAEAQPDVPVTAPAATKHEHASAADLALLRSDRTLLARVLAGLLAPFAVYVVVMLVVGGHGAQWLLWIWIPTIVGCVLAGTFLDIAHKHAASPVEPAPPVDAAPPADAAPPVDPDPVASSPGVSGS